MAATTALAAAAAVDANDPAFGAVFLCHRKLRPMTQKRSARIALRRNGRMSLTRPAAGGESCRAGFLSYKKLRFHTIKTLREDAHSAQGWMVAKATAPRRENVPRHILFYSK